MEIEPLKPFGVRVTGLDPARASESELAAVDAAFREHSFVVFPGLDPTPEQHVALVERHGAVKRGQGGEGHHYLAHDGGEHVALVMAGEISFHADETFLDEPIRIISLCAEVVPESGGETVYAHGGHAYRQLSDELRARVHGRVARHCYDASVPVYKGRFTDEILGEHPLRSEHPVVREHPFGAGPVVTVTYQHADCVLGLERAESDALLAELFDTLYAPENLYRHRWQPGDTLLWDNRVMQHARRPFDPSQRRVMRRVTVSSADSDRFEATYGGYITSATSEIETAKLGRYSGSAA